VGEGEVLYKWDLHEGSKCDASPSRLALLPQVYRKSYKYLLWLGLSKTCGTCVSVVVVQHAQDFRKTRGTT
jgi:hypothetical protein